jgi:TolC family type I secretion outer membrane protein
MRSRFILPPAMLAGVLPALAMAQATHDDPRGLIPTAPPPVSAGQAPCGSVPDRPLTLPDLVDIALCRNPQTAVSWANLRASAAATGIARSNLLPTVSATIGPVLNRNDSFGGGGGFIGGGGQIIGGSGGTTTVSTSARLAINYLLFDGGGRAAQIAAADAQARAALAQYADTAQGVVLNTITAYNSLAANRAVEAANTANLAFAGQSRDFAGARKNAGVATSADRLQAETALAQAELTLVQTRGNIATAAAQLAVAIGMPPTTVLALAPAAPLASGALLRSGAEALIADAERLRPDIMAARANIIAAEANVRSAQSLGRPNVGVTVSNSLNAIDTSINSNSGAIGLLLTLPLFSGWNTRYQIAQARAQLDQQKASAENTRQQAGLAVYSNFVALDTALASLGAARALLASAAESADLAQGRYKAGVGNFTDLLNAQSALASARQQLVQAEFNVRTANAQLARAVGSIGEAIDGER